jgi:hypothetical protein
MVMAASVTGVMAAALAVSAPADAAPLNLKWSGDSTQLPVWSQAGNWSGTAPQANGSYGRLDLGMLSNACNRGTTRAACYESENDLKGISVNAIDLSGTGLYDLSGQGITLGSGGIREVVPSQEPAHVPYEFGTPSITLPIALGADQNWIVDNGWTNTELDVNTVTGPHQLSIVLGNSELGIHRAVNTSALSITGGAGEVEDWGWLNAASRGPVTISNTTLQFLHSGVHTGPLSTSDAATVAFGVGQAPDVTADVEGAVDLAPDSDLQMSVDTPGTGGSAPVPGAGYSQLNASGAVDLSGANLALMQGSPRRSDCVNLHRGDVYTLISGTSISGRFAGIPNGRTIRLKSACGARINAALTDPTATIRYSSTAVTATIKSGGHESNVPAARHRVRIKGDPVVGHTLTAKSSWSGQPTSLRYQWLLCFRNGNCSQRRDDTPKLILRPSSAHAYVQVQVTATNRYGSESDWGELEPEIKPAPKS